MEYQRIAAAGFFPAPSTDSFLPFVAGVSWNGAGEGTGGLVFGTLLGPETTGPWSVSFSFGGGCGVWDLCFWFPGCTDHMRCFVLFGAGCVWGVWYGVVV